MNLNHWYVESRAHTDFTPSKEPTSVTSGISITTNAPTAITAASNTVLLSLPERRMHCHSRPEISRAAIHIAPMSIVVSQLAEFSFMSSMLLEPWLIAIHM